MPYEVGCERWRRGNYQNLIRVIGCLRQGFLEILVGAGYGMLDGGIPTEIPLDIVPQALRLPNSEFIVVQDRKQR